MQFPKNAVLAGFILLSKSVLLSGVSIFFLTNFFFKFGHEETYTDWCGFVFMYVCFYWHRY